MEGVVKTVPQGLKVHLDQPALQVQQVIRVTVDSTVSPEQLDNQEPPDLWVQPVHQER